MTHLAESARRDQGKPSPILLKPFTPDKLRAVVEKALAAKA